MDNTWVTQIEDNVTSYIDSSLNEKSSDILVTSEEYTGDTATFPAVYVRELSQTERGYDIDGSEISGVLSTFQLDVFANGYRECKDLSTKVMLLMKDLRFEVIASPLHTQGNGYYRSVSRYRRVIGGGDSELITESWI